MSDTAKWVANEFTERFREAVDLMTGGSCQAVWELAASSTVDRIWWEQPISFPPNSSVLVGAAKETAAKIGARVLEAAGAESTPEEARSTYQEVLTQALSGMARAIGSRFKQEGTCIGGRQLPGLPVMEAALCEVKLSDSGALIGTVLLAVPHALSAALNLLTAPARPDSAPRQKAAEPAASTVLQPIGKMDLLLDVELPVSVSFGRAQLALKDVIKLTSGSIVELNRSISEPVDIIVNNCVIARGEVVVVEGNYGVRIDQIISRQDRLRTLK
jgi:flagellar motor switch protein FliN/FliY